MQGGSCHLPGMRPVGGGGWHQGQSWGGAQGAACLRRAQGAAAGGVPRRPLLGRGEGAAQVAAWWWVGVPAERYLPGLGRVSSLRASAVWGGRREGWWRRQARTGAGASAGWGGRRCGGGGGVGAAGEGGGRGRGRRQARAAAASHAVQGLSSDLNPRPPQSVPTPPPPPHTLHTCQVLDCGGDVLKGQ